MIAEFEQSLDPILRERVRAWRHSECPPPDILEILSACLEANEPWFPVVTTFVLESDPAQWTDTTWKRRLQLLCNLWRRIWYDAGSPETLEDLSYPTPEGNKEYYRVFRGAAYALDNAIHAGRAPEDLKVILLKIRPGHYLDCMGWRNLDHLPPILLQLLVTRSKSTGKSVRNDYRSIARYLFGQREQSWGLVTACVAAALLGEETPEGAERNSPLSILGILSSVTAILTALNKNGFYPAREEDNIEKILLEYISGQLDRNSIESSRIKRFEDYMLGVDAQMRLIAKLPSQMMQLTSWLLPTPKTPIDQVFLRRRMLEQRHQRRTLQVKALMPKFTALLHIVAIRALIFQSFHPLTVEARRRFSAGDGTPEYFSHTLPDGSATMKYRVISAEQVEGELRGEKPPRKFIVGRVLVEYLGTTDDAGRTLNDPFFATLYREWYMPGSGNQKQNPINLPAGIMRPVGHINKLMVEQARTDIQKNRPVRIYLDADALCAGIAYGALAVLIALSTGMRLHELQQIRVDSGYSDKEDDNSVRFKIYPKACKRSRKSPVYHRISPQIYPYLLEAMRLHQHIWPTWSVGLPENGVEHDLERGKYLFYGREAPFNSTAMKNLMCGASEGIHLQIDGERIPLTSHLLRYGYAHARVELEHSLSDIQRDLGHRSAQMTLGYTGVLKDNISHLSRTMKIDTLWEAVQAQLPPTETS